MPMSLSPRAPDLAGLDLLVAIADEGGIGAASRVLGISQPTASERLRGLERRLGLVLVRRKRTGSALTGEGTAVVDWARPVLRSTQMLTEGTAILRGESRTRLAVGASLTVAEHLVPRWLVALSQRAPDVSVSLRMDNSSDVAQQVREDTVQLGFVEGVRAPSGLRSRTVCTDELVLIVASTHPWARKRRAVSSAQLAETGMVMRENGSGTREVLEQWMTATGHRPRAAVELASTTALVQGVLAGVGPAVVSGLAVASEVADGRLVPVPLVRDSSSSATDRAPVRLGRRIRAVWRGPGAPTPAASHLVAVALDARRV